MARRKGYAYYSRAALKGDLRAGPGRWRGVCFASGLSGDGAGWFVRGAAVEELTIRTKDVLVRRGRGGRLSG